MVKVGLVLATLLLATQVAAADRIKVAVVPGIAVNLDAGRVDALSQDLAEALSTALDVDAVGGLEVRRKLPPDGLPPDCVTTPSCAADVAKRTGANQLLFVVMVDSGGSVQIDSTWIEPASGHSASRPAIDLTSSTDSDAKAKFQAAAQKLLPDAPLRPQATGTVAIGTQTTPATPRHFTTTSLITAGVAVAGLGAGIGFGLAARSKYDSCNSDLRCRANTQDPKRDSIRHVALAADLGFVVAAGGAIATAVLFATSGEGPHVIVTPSAEGVAVTAVGRF